MAIMSYDILFVNDIFWFHEILKHVYFAGRLAQQRATTARVQIHISPLANGVKYGRCHPFYSGTYCLIFCL